MTGHDSDRDTWRSPLRTDGWAPLGAYAVLGDTRGVALVAADGAVDWLAVPAMDAPPVCAAILDRDAGGSISLAPSVPFTASRRYLDGTVVLETTFTTADGTVRVTDALNRGALGTLPWSELARRVEAVSGEVPMSWSVRPGHLLGAHQPWCHRDGGVLRSQVGELQLAVVTDRLGEAVTTGHEVHGQFVARAGTPGLLAALATEAESIFVPSAAEIVSRIGRTADAWRRWSGQIAYDGPARDLVVRSALTIKALTLNSSGAIAGAATTSLPEKMGGERNFDYRYAWVRDCSFALDALSRLGLSEEVHATLSFLVAAAAQRSPDLRTFYALDGTVVPSTMSQVDAPGHRGSQPVHVGNSAADQMQLGCFGDLLDAVWQHVRAGGQLSAGDAAMVAALADRTCDLWRSTDAGLWELGDSQHYTISKIGCWVALDRAVRLAEAGQLSSPRVDRWRAERADIHEWTDTRCWSKAKSSYTFYAGTDDLDAAVLLAARTGYCEPDDPRLASTIDAIRAELTAAGPLLFRYSGQHGKEGAFMACSCWLVEAMVHVGRTDEAAELFQDVASRASDVGLYSEEMDPSSGELLGNIPQTLSHLAVIGAATALAGSGRNP